MSLIELIIKSLEAKHLFILVETVVIGIIAMMIIAIYTGLAKSIADKFIKDKNRDE